MATLSIKRGDKIRLAFNGVLCRCLTISKKGDIVVLLGEELGVKGAHRFFSYELDKWELVDETKTNKQEQLGETENE